ncbi:MAG: methylated-DNA--[protein]-cysteine S-methyltransferase [Candidatus Eisenbacteria bacterium]
MSMILTYEVFDSPIDPLLAIVSPFGLVTLGFGGARSLASARRRLEAHVEGAEFREAVRRGGPMAPVREWFARYFSGASLEGKALPHRLYGTAFQCAVWTALFEVPAGETRSYGQLARRIGAEGAARAVGAAVGQNPIAIVAPCHRIVGADGSLTGFGGGLPRKRWLLAHEAAHAPGARPRAAARQLALWGS